MIDRNGSGKMESGSKEERKIKVCLLLAKIID